MQIRPIGWGSARAHPASSPGRSGEESWGAPLALGYEDEMIRCGQSGAWPGTHERSKPMMSNGCPVLAMPRTGSQLGPNAPQAVEAHLINTVGFRFPDGMLGLPLATLPFSEAQPDQLAQLAPASTAWFASGKQGRAGRQAMVGVASRSVVQGDRTRTLDVISRVGVEHMGRLVEGFRGGSIDSTG